MWQPGWEGSLKENGYTNGWVSSLYTVNYQNTVNQLYSQNKIKNCLKKIVDHNATVMSKQFTHIIKEIWKRSQ